MTKGKATWGNRPCLSVLARFLVQSLAVGLAVGACASGSGGGKAPAPTTDRTVRVHVQNGRTADVVVCALSGGPYVRPVGPGEPRRERQEVAALKR